MVLDFYMLSRSNFKIMRYKWSLNSVVSISSEISIYEYQNVII